MDKDVWVLLEADTKGLKNHSIALLHEGVKLCDKLKGELCAVMIGTHIKNIAQIVGSHGATHLFFCPDEELVNYYPEIYESVLCELVMKKKPYLFLSSASSLGSDLMPRIAAKIKAPLVSNCIQIKAEDPINFIKPVQKGRFHATIISKITGTKMATMNTGALNQEKEAHIQRIAEVTEIWADMEKDHGRIHYKGIMEADLRKIDINEAEFLVAIGKGAASKETLHFYQDFADRIGASVGCTRPVIDERILPYERQIGQTGKEVSPKLIVMCGISGASEFIKGIDSSSTKLAINIDSKAPIFHSADLGIVADANELVPEFIAYLNNKGKKQ